MKISNKGQIAVGVFFIIWGIMMIISERTGIRIFGYYRGLAADILGLFLIGMGCILTTGIGEKDRDQERQVVWMKYYLYLWPAFSLMCAFGAWYFMNY